MDSSRFWWQGAAPAPDPGDPGDPIGQSLRFRGLQLLDGKQGPQGDYTVSLWFKVSQTNPDINTANPYYQQFTGSTSAGYGVGIWAGSIANNQPGNANLSPAKYVDPSAWYHLVYNKDGAWINGKLEPTGAWALYSYPSGENFLLGDVYNTGDNQYKLIGYMADVYCVEQTLPPETFGRFNANGVWVPVAPSGLTYGANGFHLTFADPSDVGKDYSGSGNDFTATGFETVDTSSSDYDLMQDSPTQNYATINPLYPDASTSKANLTTANATGKPTILGIAGDVGVDGASVAWDGTEAGWTSTGAINFGQQPGGFDEFSTRTVPEPTIFDGREHFQAITDTGANILTTAQAAFPSGLWWIKDRVNANQHQLVDSVNNVSAVFTSPAGSVAAYVAPAGDSVAWCWNAEDASGGFSITNGTHGLGVRPAMVIDRAGNVWHQSLAAGQGLVIQSSGAAVSQAWTVNETRVGGPGGGTYYAWAAIPNYSAFGSYTGAFPFVYTGFKVAFVLYKNIAAGDWFIRDNAINPYNPTRYGFYTNYTFGEGDVAQLDFLSNGFKFRMVDNNQNDASGTWIWCAFAENPFNAPATAR